MEPHDRPFRGVFPRVMFGGLIAGGLFFAYNSLAVPVLPNYSLTWSQPKGWVEVSHSLVSLFRYEDPRSKAHIMGSVQQIDPDSPVRQEHDTDCLAAEALENARTSQGEWRSRRLPNLTARGETFSLIEKDQAGRSIVHAYCVKGGSISLFTYSSPKPLSKGDMSQFVAFLNDVRLDEAPRGTTTSELRRRSRPRESP